MSEMPKIELGVDESPRTRTRTSLGEPVVYGSVIKLQHCGCGRSLQALDRKFPAPSESKQHVVVARQNKSDELYWEVELPVDGSAKMGDVIANGDVIRLRHLGTRRRLH